MKQSRVQKGHKGLSRAAKGHVWMDAPPAQKKVRVAEPDSDCPGWLFPSQLRHTTEVWGIYAVSFGGFKFCCIISNAGG